MSQIPGPDPNFWQRQQHAQPRDRGMYTGWEGAAIPWYQQTFQGFDPQTGFPIGPDRPPPAELALQYQYQAERAAQQRNLRMRREARRTLEGATDIFESFRPGGAAGLLAGTYQQRADYFFRDQIQAPDLMGDYRRHEAFKARRRAQKAQTARQIAGAVVAGGALAAAIPTGGASLAALPAAMGTFSSGYTSPGQVAQQTGTGTPGASLPQTPGGGAVPEGGAAPPPPRQAGPQVQGPQPATQPPPAGPPAPTPGSAAQTQIPGTPGAPQPEGGTAAQGAPVPRGTPAQRMAQGVEGVEMATPVGFGQAGDFSPTALATEAATGSNAPIVSLAARMAYATESAQDPFWDAAEFTVEGFLRNAMSRSMI